jgi:hypothetical protein
MRESSRIPLFQAWIEYLMAWLDRRTEDMADRMASVTAFKIQEDPEAIFQEGWLLCDVGELEAGLERLRRAVEKGYYPTSTLAERPQFDRLRGDPAFSAVMDAAVAGRERALEAFSQAGGRKLIGS